ncbi:MAG: hypothetical protein QGD94_08115, partial [Planctomycetia bacterium]|nr:hypothetical protein [Planctomycetia bacterium]
RYRTNVIFLGIREAIVTNIEIRDIRDPRLALKEPLCVSLEEDEEGVTAYSYDLNTHGYGVTEDEAVQDLCESIVELFDALSEDKHRLAGPAQRQFQYLERILQHVER